MRKEGKGGGFYSGGFFYALKIALPFDRAILQVARRGQAVTSPCENPELQLWVFFLVIT
jgi:hypothetical protein